METVEIPAKEIKYFTCRFIDDENYGRNIDRCRRKILKNLKNQNMIRVNGGYRKTKAFDIKEMKWIWEVGVFGAPKRYFE